MCERPHDQDSIVYPIVYLYCHHVELMLKDIFRLGADLLNASISEGRKSTWVGTILRSCGT